MALWISKSDVVELRLNATEADLQVVIRAVYKQVLGNAHVMESERLISAESKLRDREITVRDFVRAVAYSDLYRSLFFEKSYAYRSIELNFKHLLGRAPEDQTEVAEHVARYCTQGYEADIDSYLDSDEYRLSFGENIVPYYRSNTTILGNKNNSFNRTYSLVRGYASSDAGKASVLISDIAGNLPTPIKSPIGASGAESAQGKRYRISINKANFGPRVTQSRATFEVGYKQLSKKIQNIQKTGGKILSITEVA